SACGSTTITSCSGTWPARCGAFASASSPATACAASSRPTTWIGRASSTGIAERALIEAIEAALAQRSGALVRWVGDDAAVVRSRPYSVTSVDTMVEDVHFRLGESWLTPREAGHRALAA